MNPSTQYTANHFRDYLAIFLVIGWLLNFVAFVVVAERLGGNALNGKIEDGHYFLGNHGNYTEVSYDVFFYSKIHTIFFITTHLLPFLYFGASHLRQKITNKRI
jgi:hypothetical protein